MRQAISTRQTSFNRTIVELKEYFNELIDESEATFNRTIVELKERPPCIRAAVAPLLIVP